MNRFVTGIVLAAPQPGDYDPSTGKGPEWGKAAPIGLLVILLLGIALFFLLRSFNRQLRKVPATFDAPEQVEGGPVATAVVGPADPARVPDSPDDGPQSGRRAAGADDPPG